MSGDLKDMIKYGYQPKQYVKNNSKQHVKKNSQTDEERQDIIASYQDNKQGKISDPNKIQFLKILNKVTSSTYKEPIRIVKYLADDIRNNKPDSYIKHEIDEKKKKITSVEDLLRLDNKEIETKLGINKDDVTVLKKFMKEKLDIINEFILQNAPSDLNVDDDDDDDDMEGGKRKKYRRSRKKTSHKRKTKKQKTKRRKRTTIRKKK